jgi:uncharacterized protein GlcG (DUF336 family)
MLAAGEEKARTMGIAYCIAVVDAGSNLVAFLRQDDSRIGCIDLAMRKAYTARIFNTPTAQLADMALPGKPLYGIQHSNDRKLVLLGGGVPVVIDGQIVGAIGASAGTVEQDTLVVEAAIGALPGAGHA